MKLEKKVALITGGTRGIGKAIAERFCLEGADVAIVGQTKEHGEAVAKELQQRFPSQKILFYQADVSKQEEILNMFTDVQEKLGAIEILVNNAGITKDQLLMKLSKEEWHQVMQTNLDAVFYTCQALVRAMIKARKGKIINITSVVGIIGNPGQTNYAAAKAGMMGFTKSLAKEVASRGVTVNCVAPGFIDTDMTRKLTDTQKESLLKNIPMQRLGDVHDIAKAVVFLASDDANYITGQTLTVDGGMVM